jgi:beta-glucosidase-like glycosyl hydrolase
MAAVHAGNDLVLLGEGNTDKEAQAIAALRSAVAAGEVSPAQVRDSAARVVALRLRYEEREYFQAAGDSVPDLPIGDRAT